VSGTAWLWLRIAQTQSQRTEPAAKPLGDKPFKQWGSIFNNDSTIASAVLDRLLHHAETIVIEGASYRMKDQPGD
jgi:DNA replication protein DnaC